MTSLLGISLLIVPLAYYALYTLTIKGLSKRKTDKIDFNPSFAPCVSVIIPTYNEVKTIEKRIRNFEDLEYPTGKIEVLFVDGASTDGTPELIDRLKNQGRSYIHLVRQPSRQGYNSAIYEGINQAKSDIVITSEVGAMFHPRAITSVVRHLAQPSIGVATGKSVLSNPSESLATRLEAAYRETHDEIRYAESVIDSTPDMKGELLAFRKEIGLRLRPGETISESGSFDMCLSYMARMLGLRAIFDPEAVFYEYTPVSMRDRMTVQIRRGASFTGALWNFRSVIFNRKLGYFGLLIAPSRFMMLIVLPWVLLSSAFVLLIESLSQPLIGGGVLALALVGLLYKRTRYTLLSFILSQIVLAIATFRLLLRRHTQIINTLPTARR